MDLEADAMPQPVRETIPKSSCRKAGTRYRIKFHRPRPRDCGLASGPLSTLNGGMNPWRAKNGGANGTHAANYDNGASVSATGVR